ncbi:hypothetical protein [Nocardia xishanensis]|uniref:Uncharacterized protein n=1 Tax=Nocardia xishanensis TaxID=238964 RepID=A0ABW7X4C6_9NOCA
MAIAAAFDADVFCAAFAVDCASEASVCAEFAALSARLVAEFRFAPMASTPAKDCMTLDMIDACADAQVTFCRLRIEPPV